MKKQWQSICDLLRECACFQKLDGLTFISKWNSDQNTQTYVRSVDYELCYEEKNQQTLPRSRSIEIKNKNNNKSKRIFKGTSSIWCASIACCHVHFMDKQLKFTAVNKTTCMLYMDIRTHCAFQNEFYHSSEAARILATTDYGIIDWYANVIANENIHSD